MATATRPLRTKLRRLEALAQARRLGPALDRLRADPTSVFSAAGMTADAWQRDLLRAPFRRLLMLATRQGGKSQTAAALALCAALLRPGALVLLLSPSLRQSGELFRAKFLPLYNALGRPVAATQESALQLTLANNSRVVSLPGDEETVRCFSSVTMLIIDEAARVSDELYRSVRPMLAVSQGKLVALSTPFGQRGWFYDEWHGGGGWDRVKVTADQCPRIDAAFLEEERRALGETWYRQEYLCSFESLSGAVFPADAIDAMFDEDLEPEALPI
jgi:hypothetical protein